MLLVALALTYLEGLMACKATKFEVVAIHPLISESLLPIWTHLKSLPSPVEYAADEAPFF